MKVVLLISFQLGELAGGVLALQQVKLVTFGKILELSKLKSVQCRPSGWN